MPPKFKELFKNKTLEFKTHKLRTWREDHICKDGIKFYKMMAAILGRSKKIKSELEYYMHRSSLDDLPM